MLRLKPGSSASSRGAKRGTNKHPHAPAPAHGHGHGSRRNSSRESVDGATPVTKNRTLASSAPPASAFDSAPIDRDAIDREREAERRDKERREAERREAERRDAEMREAERRAGETQRRAAREVGETAEETVKEALPKEAVAVGASKFEGAKQWFTNCKNSSARFLQTNQAAARGLCLADPATCSGERDLQEAVRSLQGRVHRYQSALSNVSSVDDLVDLNRREFGSALAGGENVVTGLVFGYCSGFALRRIGRGVALAMGVGYLGLQYLNYSGYVSVKWKQIEETMESGMDLNNDGVVDSEDLKIARNRVMEVVTFGLPSTCGFAAGLLYGWRGKIL